MPKKLARSGFKHIKDNDLLSLANTVLSAMTVASATFPTPEPPLTDLEAARDDFQAKLEAAQKKGSPGDTSRKNESKVVLADVLEQMAFYVNKIANGVLSVAQSSGFPTVGDRAPQGVPQIPVNHRMKDGENSGQVILEFEHVPEAWMYEYQYTSVTDVNGFPVWGTAIHTSTGSRNIPINGLMPDVRHYVRVRSRNGHGISDWSHTVSLMVR